MDDRSTSAFRPITRSPPGRSPRRSPVPIRRSGLLPSRVPKASRSARPASKTDRAGSRCGSRTANSSRAWRVTETVTDPEPAEDRSASPSPMTARTSSSAPNRRSSPGATTKKRQCRRSTSANLSARNDPSRLDQRSRCDHEAGSEAAELDVSGDGSRVLVGKPVSSEAGNTYWHLYMHLSGRAPWSST